MSRRPERKMVRPQTIPPARATAWDVWRDLATGDAMAASESDKARMIERHKIVVNIIDVNSRQLRCESAIAGLDIERACAVRDADADNPSPEAKALLDALDKRMSELSDESQRLATQREFLNASLSEFDAAASAAPEQHAGRA